MTRYLLWGGMMLMVLTSWAVPDTLYLGQLNGHQTLFQKAAYTFTPIRRHINATNLDSLRALPDWKILEKSLTTQSQQAYWLHFVIHNDTDLRKVVYVYTSSVNQSVRFSVFRGDSCQILQSGTMTPSSQWATSENDTYIPLEIDARQTIRVFGRISHQTGILPFLTDFKTPKPSLNLQIESEDYYQKRILREYRANMPEFQYRSWIQGALALAMLFVGLLYVKYRQPIYAYYWVYIVCSFVFSLLKTRAYTPLGHSLGEWPLLKNHLMETLLWWGIGAYLFFMIELLDLKKNNPHIRIWFRRLAVLLWGYGVVYLTVMLLTNDGGLQKLSFWGGRFIAFPLYLFTLIWIRRSVKSPMVPYVILANAVLGFFGMLAWLRAGEVILKGVKLPANLDDLLTLSFAVVAEIIVLSLAIAHRVRLLEKEKTESQLAYFEELQNKSFYEKRMAETEMLALRSQMNPHFLFNSLNSLEYLIMSNDEKKASSYLAKFSKLLRMILNHSREESISLEEELTALRYYLDIEAMRLGDDFEYQIEVQRKVDVESLIIPPLLLQPFVENAIWHGLMPSHLPSKKLAIRIRSKDDKKVEFEIEDNGIGRKKATELRNRSTVRRKSYGMDITQQRIDLFNRNYPNQLTIEVFDLQKEGQTGTLVRIIYQIDNQ